MPCQMRLSSALPELRSIRDDRSTPRVFGEYADVYDVRQAVEDGATKPLFYESRIVKLTVDDTGAKAAEAQIEQVTAASKDGTDTPDNVRVPLEALDRCRTVLRQWHRSS